MSRGPDEQTVDLVFERDSNCCICCGKGLSRDDRGWSWSLHHRRGRDGKPDSHMPQNLITVCGRDNVSWCHGRIHQRRSEAQLNGWWLSRIAGTDPLTVAVLVDHGSRWVYLTADGRYSDSPPEVADE